GTTTPPLCNERYPASSLPKEPSVTTRTRTMPAAADRWLTTQRRSTIAQSALYLGALAVLATGVLHIQQYYGQDYSTVPTIGTLFFLNFVSAVVVAVGL